MKTKTKIGKQLKKKTSNELVNTIIESKKNEKWNGVAAILSGPRSRRLNLNLGEINRISKTGEALVVPGKILSQGEIDKKIKIIAFGFSENAREKLLKAGCEIKTISDEIKKNPDAKGLRILTGK